MPRFFVNADQIEENTVVLFGDDAHHVSRSLRMAVGETITVCDGAGTEYLCRLSAFLPDCVCADILQKMPSETEPPYRAIVWQALPKGEKLDSIIQKSVECGASEIALFESERCIVRMKDGENGKKTDRRNRIAQEAAKQSGRGIIPCVLPPVSFREAVKQAAGADLPLFCYEGAGTRSLHTVLSDFHVTDTKAMQHPTVSIMVGSEGGFSEKEAKAAQEAGMIPVNLGPRILRTETAASFVLGCLVYELELL